MNQENDEGAENKLRCSVLLTVQPSPFSFPEELIDFHPSEDDMFRVTNSVVLRQIHSNTKLKEEEIEDIQQFREYCDSKGIGVPLQMQSLLLRILAYTQQKSSSNDVLPKSVELLQEMESFRVSSFPFSDDEKCVQEDLQNGTAYWMGRDDRLRPCLVINLLNWKQIADATRITRLLGFCLEYAIRYMLCPGKVETASIICDARGIPFYSVPVAMVQEVIHLLSRQYCGRMHSLFLLIDSQVLLTSWNLIKRFLPTATTEKITVLRLDELTDILKQRMALHQISDCYGGTNPVETQKRYYPFPVLPGPFDAHWSEGPITNCNPNCHQLLSSDVCNGSLLDVDDPVVLWTEDQLKALNLQREKLTTTTNEAA